jgi:ribosomal protein L40E
MDWQTLLNQHSRLLLSIGFGAVSFIVLGIAGLAFLRKEDRPSRASILRAGSALGSVIPITRAPAVRCIHCGTKMPPHQSSCLKCGDLHPLRPTGSTGLRSR